MSTPGGCSCGVPWCRELGWSHEWDPRWQDSCAVCGEPIQGSDDEPVRVSCGYAHGRCVNVETPV